MRILLLTGKGAFGRLLARPAGPARHTVVRAGAGELSVRLGGPAR